MGSNTMMMDIGSSLDAFIDVQGRHLQNLQVGRIGKLQEWLDERRQTLAGLRQSFAAAHEAGIDDGLRMDLLKKLSRILDHEKMIQRLAARKKEAIATKLVKVRTGKKALEGYSQKATGLRREGPRFVSSKG